MKRINLLLISALVVTGSAFAAMTKEETAQAFRDAGLQLVTKGRTLTRQQPLEPMQDAHVRAYEQYLAGQNNVEESNPGFLSNAYNAVVNNPWISGSIAAAAVAYEAAAYAGYVPSVPGTLYKGLTLENLKSGFGLANLVSSVYGYAKGTSEVKGTSEIKTETSEVKTETSWLRNPFKHNKDSQ